MPDAGFAGIGLEPGDQLLEVMHRQAVLDADQQRLVGKLGDRRQIVEQIEIQFVEAADQNIRGQGADAQRVAVGRRVRDLADADGAGRAGEIFDNDRLSERLAHRIGDHPRQNVGGAAGGERHDDRDRPGRIIGREGEARISAGGADRRRRDEEDFGVTAT